jgi:hypothetical protein
MKTVRFAVEVSVEDKVDVAALADDLLDYLCAGGDGTVEYPPGIFSADNVEMLPS